MKRPLKPEELRLWGLVAGTAHPLPGRSTPETPSPPPRGEGPGVRAPAQGQAVRLAKGAKLGSPPSTPPLPTPSPRGGEGFRDIEPRRKHRIAKARDPIGARLDLHGLDQDRARAALEAFLRRAWDEGYRAVLVITGKGVTGDGILRRRTPEWLAAPYLAEIVAGVSEAHRRHGGEGALYVALKRKPRG
ncbi:Smr/MutS family protein [Phenylobacterium sp.]|uniref:Smr/MutS family protein n=1 Tax=Phenylobacterium sp. TaxID=1871053 RepID=UPI002625F4DA|nr:Smr/MutS family protein [Phenylobacterium sp.]